ncbi:DUF494 family protein [Deferribacter abyssi]|uniref:DUF494 family protein n=1 Tax=Deferribacter abyssi TaxID=213806 RepID=UPI003C25FEE2
MDKILIALNLIMDFVEAYDNIDEIGITDMLYNSGFEEYEVRQALAFLDFGNFSEINGIRYFSPSEKDKFSEDAMQYIQKLQLSGTVDLMIIEEVVDRCMESDIKVDVEMVKQTLLVTLIENRKFYIDIDKNVDELLN